MKRILAITVAAAALGFVASAASAQSVKGELDLSGQVQPKCSVVTGQAGGHPNPDFGDQFTFPNDLSGNDGKLASYFQTTFIKTNNPVSFSYQVVCNSNNPTIALTVNPMITGAGGASSNTIDFTGEVDAKLSPSGTFTQTATTNLGPASKPATAIGGPLSGAINDITLMAYNFTNAGGAELAAGTYNGSVQVTIAPQ
jgi:hypothetical protein